MADVIGKGNTDVRKKRMTSKSLGLFRIHPLFLSGRGPGRCWCFCRCFAGAFAFPFARAGLLLRGFCCGRAVAGWPNSKNRGSELLFFGKMAKYRGGNCHLCFLESQIAKTRGPGLLFPEKIAKLRGGNCHKKMTAIKVVILQRRGRD